MSNPKIPAPPSAKSKWRPIVLTTVSALFLGAGSCFGAFSDVGNTLSLIFSGMFMTCVVVFVGALLWALGTWLKSAKRGGSQDG